MGQFTCFNVSTPSAKPCSLQRVRNLVNALFNTSGKFRCASWCPGPLLRMWNILHWGECIISLWMKLLTPRGKSHVHEHESEYRLLQKLNKIPFSAQNAAFYQNETIFFIDVLLCVVTIPSQQKKQCFNDAGDCEV